MTDSIVFGNDFIGCFAMTEGADGDLAILNPRGVTVMVLDGEGGITVAPEFQGRVADVVDAIQERLGRSYPAAVEWAEKQPPEIDLEDEQT